MGELAYSTDNIIEHNASEKGVYDAERKILALANTISSKLSYSSMIILGYQKGCSPIYLYGSDENKNIEYGSFFVSYAHDPFYSLFVTKNNEGICSIFDASQEQEKLVFFKGEYIFNRENGDELAVCVRLDDSRWITIFLKRGDEKFSLSERVKLGHIYNRICKECWELWSSSWMPVGTNTDETVSRTVSYTLSTFCSDVLTYREKEIVTLLILGFDNKTIARKIGISVYTVKVHRKSAYSKLGVSSIGELFQVFFSYLLK